MLLEGCYVAVVVLGSAKLPPLKILCVITFSVNQVEVQTTFFHAFRFTCFHLHPVTQSWLARRPGQKQLRAQQKDYSDATKKNLTLSEGGWCTEMQRCMDSNTPAAVWLNASTSRSLRDTNLRCPFAPGTLTHPFVRLILPFRYHLFGGDRCAGGTHCALLARVRNHVRKHKSYLWKAMKTECNSVYLHLWLAPLESRQVHRNGVRVGVC